MSNDEAVRVLRDVVQKPGPIKVQLTLISLHIFDMFKIVNISLFSEVLVPSEQSFEPKLTNSRA